MTLWYIPLGIYVAVYLVLLGAFLFQEMSFENPDYVLATLAPLLWPALVWFAALKRFVNYRRSK